VDLDKLPCGDCHYCTKAHSHWGRFNDDVDDVVLRAYNVRVLNTMSHDQTEDMHSSQENQNDAGCEQSVEICEPDLSNWVEQYSPNHLHSLQRKSKHQSSSILDRD